MLNDEIIHMILSHPINAEYMKSIDPEHNDLLQNPEEYEIPYVYVALPPELEGYVAPSEMEELRYNLGQVKYKRAMEQRHRLQVECAERIVNDAQEYKDLLAYRDTILQPKIDALLKRMDEMIEEPLEKVPFAKAKHKKEFNRVGDEYVSSVKELSNVNCELRRLQHDAEIRATIGKSVSDTGLRNLAQWHHDNPDHDTLAGIARVSEEGRAANEVSTGTLDEPEIIGNEYENTAAGSSHKSSSDYDNLYKCTDTTGSKTAECVKTKHPILEKVLLGFGVLTGFLMLSAYVINFFGLAR
jgi:hypothetical protein